MVWDGNRPRVEKEWGGFLREGTHKVGKSMGGGHDKFTPESTNQLFNTKRDVVLATCFDAQIHY